MLLYEFYEAGKKNFQDVEDDNSAPKYTEGRKTKLFLWEINKIRRMREVQSFEKAKDLKKIRQQYKPAEQEAGGPML